MVGRVVLAGLLGPACVLTTIGAPALPRVGWLLLGGSAGLLVAFLVPLLARGDAGTAGPEPPVGPAPAAAEPPGSSVPPPVPVAGMATEELCLAWRRSYFLLLLAADLQARRLVVERRQDFLDEIERRDRSGFLRWLADGARAGGDPAPYLTTRT
ncbi:hypothetical protein SAMN04489727_7217 [Amycolatopsis tolypomycina]|uniref:Uncharacterized protein n=1 Tax=Amycolatopsis tolypomycina TaxID=208445 RepID=A0A1H4ZCS6_9PSEU|nr:hypothetical protein SAMN04489727_7217 [Amycolatopsis tolypomycina]